MRVAIETLLIALLAGPLPNAAAEDGASLLAKNQLTEARDAFQAAIDKNPKNASAHAGLVRTRLRLDEWRDAVREAKRAVEVLPDSATSHAILGHALKRAGKLSAATVEWRRAAAIDPNDFEACVGLADAEALSGHWSASADVAQRAIALAPDRPEPWLLLRNALDNQGRSVEAAGAAGRLLKLAPKGVPYDMTLETLPGEIAMASRLGMASLNGITSSKSSIDLQASFTFGYLSTEIVVDDHEPILVVLDTGGSTCLNLDETIARKYGLEKMGDVPARGASGTIPAWLSLAKSVNVHGLEISNVPITAFDMKPIFQGMPRVAGVLGVGWVLRDSIVVDFQRRAISVEKPAFDAVLSRPDRAVAEIAGDETTVRIPFWLVADAKIVFEVECNGEPELAVLDTGSPMVLVSKGYVVEHTPKDALKSIPPLGGGVGTGAKPEDWVTGGPITMRIAGIDFPVSPVIGMPMLDSALSVGLGVRTSFLIGNSFLSQAKRARIDYANRVLTLEGLKK